MIKAIIFDCFGVLTSDTWNEFLEGLPKEVDVEQIRAIHRAYDSGLISKEECSSSIKEISGSYFVEIEDINQNNLAKNKILIKYIETNLSNYKLGILSNISSNWIRDELLDANEQSLFNTMVFSYEVGMVKPDKNIFIDICTKLEVELGETVLIDDVDRYCYAAKDLGMKAIIYQNFEQMKSELESILEMGDTDK